jgi:hypothetical protein
MKIAICGVGPTGTSACQYFQKLGASTSNFSESELQRVHKTFLRPSQEAPHNSRLIDLFRVVTKTAEECERYQDFDLVIDAREAEDHPLAMGPSHSYALNEPEQLDAVDLFYGASGAKRLLELSKSPEQVNKRVTLVGSGRLALESLVNLGEWVFENSISLVTSEEIPFLNLKNEATHSELIATWEGHLDRWDQTYRDKCEAYRQEVMNYRESAVSIAPAEPTPPIDLICNSTVVALDRLEDQPGVFLTTEEAPFLVKNADHKTIAADLVLIATGHRLPNGLFNGLRQGAEAGFYLLRSSEALEPQLKLIEQDMLSFFSKVK